MISLRHLLGRFRDPLRRGTLAQSLLIRDINRGVPIPQYNLTATPERKIGQSELEDPEFQSNYKQTQAILGEAHVLTDGTIVTGYHSLLKNHNVEVEIDGKGRPTHIHLRPEKDYEDKGIERIGKDENGFYLEDPRRDSKIPTFIEQPEPEFI
jgi:hypothetical protein